MGCLFGYFRRGAGYSSANRQSVLVEEAERRLKWIKAIRLAPKSYAFLSFFLSAIVALGHFLADRRYVPALWMSIGAAFGELRDQRGHSHSAVSSDCVALL
jgi:hypothetical protein